MSSFLELFIYFTVGLLTILYFLGKKSRCQNYPPGPWGLPILGHLPFLGKSAHTKFVEWGKIYGPVIAVDFGLFPTVILNDVKLIKTALNDSDISGRPDLPTFSARSGGQKQGIILTDGKKWSENRRFIIRTLRDFGFGTKSMEVVVHEEIQELIESFGKVLGSPVSTQNRFNAAVLNALWTLIAGERFKQDDPELQVAIKHLTSNIQDNSIRASLSNFIPPLAKYFPKLSGFAQLIKGIHPILEFLRRPIEQHRATFVAGQPRDVIDVILEEMQKSKDVDSSFYKENGEQTILYLVFDLFLAGAETTSTTLTWTFLYLAKFPEKQKKLQAEIAKVVGDSRLPSLADRPSMPYTEAVIHEVMRYSSLVPLGVVHSALKDVQIGGFDIPKNTMIMPNAYAVHFDPKIWGDPNNFRPERFLNSDETTVVKNEAFLAFSAGKRVCLGETLARDELFLFTASLFQAFTVGPVTCVEDLSTEAFVGGFLNPLPHELILKSRLN